MAALKLSDHFNVNLTSALYTIKWAGRSPQIFTHHGDVKRVLACNVHRVSPVVRNFCKLFAVIDVVALSSTWYPSWPLALTPLTRKRRYVLHQAPAQIHLWRRWNYALTPHCFWTKSQVGKGKKKSYPIYSIVVFTQDHKSGVLANFIKPHRSIIFNSKPILFSAAFNALGILLN